MTIRTEGPTPSGGAYAIATFYLNGLEVDGPQQADSVEIVEYDDHDEQLLRTYGGDFPERDEAIDVGSAAAEFDTYDQDILKLGTWDLYTNGVLITTLDQLLESLDVHDSPQRIQRDTVAATLDAPSWQAAPPGLKVEVYGWLDDIGAL